MRPRPTRRSSATATANRESGSRGRSSRAGESGSRGRSSRAGDNSPAPKQRATRLKWVSPPAGRDRQGPPGTRGRRRNRHAGRVGSRAHRDDHPEPGLIRPVQWTDPSTGGFSPLRRLSRNRHDPDPWEGRECLCGERIGLFPGFGRRGCPLCALERRLWLEQPAMAISSTSGRSFWRTAAPRPA